MIQRLLEKHVVTDILQDSQSIVVLGARQVGKTTLVKDIRKKISDENTRVLYLDCEIEEQKNAIDTASMGVLSQLLKDVDLLFVDEAQKLKDPGRTIKIIHDHFPNIRVLLTGSSSLDLQNKLTDAMTGRTFEFKLFPLSFVEVLAESEGGGAPNAYLQKQEADELLPSVLMYGLYPAVYTENDPIRKQRLLVEITKKYLFKDVLDYSGIKNSQAIQDLARALAYQIGSEVNESELAKRLGIDGKTVANYIDVLEKAFVLVRLPAYANPNNPRRAIGGKYKVFFVDVGMRNALIGDFNPPHIRNDRSELWENFLIVERMKAYANKNQQLLHYNFWRSYDGAEVDYIEKPYDKPLSAYEFKYGDGRLKRGVYSFAAAYGMEVKLINQGNYLEFVSDTAS